MALCLPADIWDKSLLILLRIGAYEKIPFISSIEALHLKWSRRGKYCLRRSFLSFSVSEAETINLSSSETTTRRESGKASVPSKERIWKLKGQKEMNCVMSDLMKGPRRRLCWAARLFSFGAQFPKAHLCSCILDATHKVTLFQRDWSQSEYLFIQRS